MLDALKFVKGAVASKGFSPELTHFKIENGLVKGFNGRLALCSPIDLDIEVAPKALPFIKAITACKTTTAMHITKAGRLGIKSGKFKAFIECVTEIYPEVEPEGEKIKMTGSFISILKTLAPFMAEDASRPWSRGILLKGRSAFATNNIVIVQAWLSVPFPVEVNIPSCAIKELIRIKEEPVSMCMTDRTITFFYENGRWLRTNLNSTDWPDVDKILGLENKPSPVPAGLFEAIQDIAPFVDEAGRVMLRDGTICTSEEEGLGASVVVDGLPDHGTFNYLHLLRLEGIAEKIDFEMHPAPCIFYGHNMRGAIIGMKDV